MRLRPWREADLAPFAAINADPVVMEHFPSVLERASSDALAERIGGHFDRHGYGLWAVVLKATGEVIGLCGLIRREGLEHADIGYSFLERHWRQGYAVEAASAVLRHAREVIGLPTVVAITDPSNTGSIAVLGKIGLRPAGTIQVPGYDGESSYFTT